MRDALRERSRELVAALADRPRATGTDEEAAARLYCAGILRDSGMETHEEEFIFSSFAGKFATPVAGGLVISLFATCTIAAAAGKPLLALVLLLAHLAALGIVWLASTSHAILHLQVFARCGVNLVAKFGAAPQRLWLIAHVDSKSQPVSILMRAAGITWAVALLLALVAALFLQLLVGVVPGVVWDLLGVAGVLSGIPVLLTTTGNRSHGALDNASGVAAVILAAEMLAERGIRDFGVLITGAEELGLAGAHAWGAANSAGCAINCDSIDDSGDFLLLTGRRDSGSVADAVRAAAARFETPMRERRMLTGILVDSVALERRGWDVVTLCRGTRESLSRIHTVRDTVTHCSGSGASEGALLVADAAAALLKNR